MTDSVQDHVFDGSPLFKLQQTLGLKTPSYPRSLQWACLAVLVGWVPLLVLSILEGTLLLPEKGFLSDFAVHARSLVAVPILILAEMVCTPRLNAIVRNFINMGLIAPSDYGRFTQIITSTLRLRDSNLTDVILTALAYMLIFTSVLSVPTEMLPDWHRTGNAVIADRSLAGWWHSLVSLPLMTVLLFGWLWRLILWGRFLFRISRLDLQLVPSHPDRAGGLMFLGSALQALCTIALAIGVIAAGTVANYVVHNGVPIANMRFTLGALVAANLVIFCLPFCVFGQPLFKARLRGVAEYGNLAGRVGREFELKWFDRSKVDYEDALQQQDFSATTDLYQVAANVYAIRMVPLTIRDIGAVALATLVPFIPVAFMALPFEVIFSRVTGMLF